MLDPNTLALLAQLGVRAETAEAVVSNLLILTVVTLLAAIPTALVARAKRRSVALWLLFALSIPVIPLLIVWLLPAATPDDAS